MLTWGIDWATEAGDRGAVLIDWADAHARVVEVRRGGRYLKDDQVLDLLTSADVAMVAIDVPFGWPVDFHAFLGAHALGRSLPYPRLHRARTGESIASPDVRPIA